MRWEQGAALVLPVGEFIARLGHHVLAEGFKRIRRHGLLATAYKEFSYACREG